LKERYELKGPEGAGTVEECGDDGAVERLVARMRKSLQGSGIASRQLLETDNEDSEQQIELGEKGKKTNNPGVWKRLRWGAHDRARFAQQVTRLKNDIDILNQLLSETSFQKNEEDNKRVNIIVVGSAIDERSLSLVQQAAGVVDRPNDDDIEISSMAKRKALAEKEDDEEDEIIAPPMEVSVLAKGDFIFHDSQNRCSRFLTTMKKTRQIVVLEKKAYNPVLPYWQKEILLGRLQRLVLLMANRTAASFRVPQALGYISDPENNCWWLVFNYALEPRYSTSYAPSSVTTPLTLAELLASSVKIKPSLDFRLALARTFSTTVSALYSSGWLHKSLRSTSILFPVRTSDVQVVPIQGSKDALGLASQMLLSGFEYSRPEASVPSIDRGLSTNDIASAIYRHPRYQGEAISGYRIEYDIYSVGLILTEIALWMPLLSFLDVKTKDPGSEPGMKLSSKMTRFQSAEAAVLKQRVIERMKEQGSFRVGTQYAQAAIWCLEAADKELGGESSDGQYTALDFYNHVVVPLGKLKL
jgi:hypothetical protein